MSLIDEFRHRFRLPSYAHQAEGTTTLVRHPIFALWDEPGAGKTKQVIDAAQILHAKGVINRVVVLVPAAVRFVWFDPELGELAKHLWEGQNSLVTEWHSKRRQWYWGDPKDPHKLKWIITNYDFIRPKERWMELAKYVVQSKTWIVADESSALNNSKSQQSKATYQLRTRAQRITLLNGTPITNSIGDLFGQSYVMSPKIFGMKSFFQFRSRYAVMEARSGFPKILGWKEIDKIQATLAPYVLIRLKKDCLDLPEKLPSQLLNVSLDPETWKIYRDMRDDLVSQLDDTNMSIASQAGTKVIRLAQITSGFLGGVSEIVEEEAERPDFIPSSANFWPTSGPMTRVKSVIDGAQEIGTAKLDFFLEWLDARLLEDPKYKILVWSRFRPEVLRLRTRIIERNSLIHVGLIFGGQKRSDRDKAIRMLDPRTAPDGPVVVIGTPSSGSMGLSLVAAWNVFYMSNDVSLKVRKQSEDRVHRPGQVRNVNYYDLVATGPKGQKTIDHTIIKSLKDKEDLARLTASAWVKILRDEIEVSI